MTWEEIAHNIDKKRITLNEMYDIEDDKYTYIEIDHVRRPRITLKHLQKLRKVRSIEKVEKAHRLNNLSAIYGKPEKESPW